MNKYPGWPFRFPLAFGTLVVGSAGALAAGPRPPPAGFDEATIHVERNATDGDTEVVLNLTAGDEGLRVLRLRTPDGRDIATVASHDPASQGLREFAFESPEPEGESILASYPEGVYTFYGRSTSGERFRSLAELSHQMPDAPVIINPAPDEVVSGDVLTIQWSPGSDVAEYRIEFENESADPEQVLELNVQGSVTSFEVPADLLVPGAQYQIGIAAVGDNGNVTVTETTFSTAD